MRAMHRPLLVSMGARLPACTRTTGAHVAPARSYMAASPARLFGARTAITSHVPLVARHQQAAIMLHAHRGSGNGGILLDTKPFTSNLLLPQHVRCGSVPGPAAMRRMSSASSSVTLAAIIERVPIITPPMPEWEKPTVELRRERAEKFTKVYPERFTTADEGPDRKQARLRMEAVLETEGLRESEADRTGDERSVERKMDKRLYLLLHQNGEWRLPQAAYVPDASSTSVIRDSLSSAVSASCGGDLRVHQLGNAPLAHFESGGRTTFFWKMTVVDGAVEVARNDDFAWLTKEELASRLGGELGDLLREICGPYD